MKRTVIALLLIVALAAITSAAPQKVQKAIDPVCGLSVDKVPALSYTYKGETYYFCATADLNKFKESPDRWAKKPSPPR